MPSRSDPPHDGKAHPTPDDLIRAAGRSAYLGAPVEAFLDRAARMSPVEWRPVVVLYLELSGNVVYRIARRDLETAIAAQGLGRAWELIQLRAREIGDALQFAQIDRRQVPNAGAAREALASAAGALLVRDTLSAAAVDALRYPFTGTPSVSDRRDG